jgi:hypothetical protein
MGEYSPPWGHNPVKYAARLDDSAESVEHPGQPPNHMLQRTGGTVAVLALVVQTQVGSGFVARR